jgi:hypothetical protein
MHTVQIADDVYAALQRVAVPFEEDINDVLRRVLDVPRDTNGKRHARHPRPDDISTALTQHPAARVAVDGNDGPSVVVYRRTTNGEALPQSTYRAAVIGILRSTHDSISATTLMRAIEHQLASRMTDNDLETLPSGLLRWQSQTRNALVQLRHDGTIEQVDDGRFRFRGSA